MTPTPSTAPPRTPSGRGPARAGAVASVTIAAAVLSSFAAPTLVAAASTPTTLSAEGAQVAPIAVAASQQPAILAPTDGLAALDRSTRTSRSAQRREVPVQPDADSAPDIIGTRYAEVALKVRTRPAADADVVAVLDRGDAVKATDVKEDGFRQVVYKGDLRWVKAEYLSTDKPRAGLSTSRCASGSGVENGLQSTTVAVHRAVCAEFPTVTTYGGIRGGGGNHGTGHALDIMISNRATGDQIAAFVRAHAAELGVSEVIWRQRIWTVQRSSEGWRPMPDRGSATANHYDHVHVSTY